MKALTKEEILAEIKLNWFNVGDTILKKGVDVGTVASMELANDPEFVNLVISDGYLLSLNMNIREGQYSFVRK